MGWESHKQMRIEWGDRPIQSLFKQFAGFAQGRALSLALVPCLPIGGGHGAHGRHHRRCIELNRPVTVLNGTMIFPDLGECHKAFRTRFVARFSNAENLSRKPASENQRLNHAPKQCLKKMP